LPAVHAGRLAESQGFPSYYSHLNTMWTSAFGQAATKTFYPPTGTPPNISNFSQIKPSKEFQMSYTFKRSDEILSLLLFLKTSKFNHLVGQGNSLKISFQYKKSLMTKNLTIFGVCFGNLFIQRDHTGADPH
jgi:hypothetical protein